VFSKSIFWGAEIMTKSLHKVKIFKSIQQDISIMENEINQWLNENSDIQIIQLTQSEIGSKRARDVILTILYTEPHGS
jgi:hypothetical protein